MDECHCPVFEFIDLFFILKKKEVLSSATTWTNLEGITLSEINQAEEDKSCMVSRICGNQTQKSNSKTESTKVGCQGMEGGENGEIGKRYKLLAISGINSEDLMNNMDYS